MKLFKDMYLRGYAHWFRRKGTKSEGEIRDYAAYTLMMTLTAPLIAVELFIGALWKREHPSAFAGNDIPSFLFLASSGGLSLLVYLIVSLRFRNLEIPEGLVITYDTPSQRLCYWMQMFFGIVCIAVGGSFVVVMAS